MITDLIILCLAAFAGGFIDAIVGGGGLVQTPATIMVLPQYPIAVALGTIKIPSFCGTSIAAVQYSRHVKMNYKHLAAMTAIAFLSAIAGSKVVTLVSNSFMKPFILIILTGVAFYTYSKKDFGIHTSKHLTPIRELLYAVGICLPLGFYDGFIGPGTGSFLILLFIAFLGYDFLQSSAYAKVVNLSTNLGSILFFMSTGRILFHFALPMAAFNALGGFLGAKLAILRGNTFIRIFFLSIVTATMLRYAYAVFFK